MSKINYGQGSIITEKRGDKTLYRAYFRDHTGRQITKSSIDTYLKYIKNKAVETLNQF